MAAALLWALEAADGSEDMLLSSPSSSFSLSFSSYNTSAWA